MITLQSPDYTGTYKFLGGYLSLDFVNTVSWPNTPRAYDWLQDTNGLFQWIEASPLKQYSSFLKKNGGKYCTPEQMQRIHDVRANLYDILKRFAFKEEILSEQVKGLNDFLAEARIYKIIDSNTLQWHWTNLDSPEKLIYPIVDDAAQLITTADLNRLKYCPTCHWLFYDTSKNKSRKWCDMNDCGSRSKALKYYYRKKITD